MTSPAQADARIVVGVDGSDHSKEALAWAAHMAQLTGDALVIVTTWHLPAAAGAWGIFPEDWNPADDALAAVNDAIKEVLGPEEAANATVVVRNGAPAHELIDESSDARMLVVGSRGLGGFTGLLLGSVSAQCAEHAHCPVVIVHAPRED
jgi:nucleotide-binding universal stress UspA family protein